MASRQRALPPMRPISVRLAVASAVLLALPAAAQVDYSLAFEPGGERWKVEVRLAGRGEESLDFWLPLWTPGAYHVADFGRFVKALEARDASGNVLGVERPETGHFVVRGTGAAEEIVLAYEADSASSGIYSNEVIDVESNRIRADYAFVNPSSLFGFVPSRAAEPVRLAVALPDGWQAATVLERDAQGRYLAPSYMRFEDSPFLFSPSLEAAEFSVDGKPHRVSVHGRSAEDVQEIAQGCQRIVQAGSQLMRGLPYDRYHFLYGFVEEAGGSGLEHSFSTLILVSPDTSIEEEEGRGFWGITAHEFFHLWCAERIHVEEIHRPDLTRSLETGTIWVNEGITEYFCRHLLLHAGFLEEDELLRGYLEGHFPEGLLKKQSWTDVSRETPDWRGMADVMNFAMRMYAVGPRTIFALDLCMRRATDGERGVLDLLHHLLDEYVAEDRGFGEEELDEILATLAGQPALDFYRRYIDGEEIPDPAQFLDVLGYRFEDGALAPLDSISPAQESARRDYFSASGKP